MYAPPHVADQMIRQAVSLAAAREETLDEIPAPVYVTDASGTVTHANRACFEFAGRKPQLGVDRWCVTWKLWTEDGEFLPHDQCPMAVAVQSGRVVRGVSAIAERPDGKRVRFLPYPTPLLTDDGTVLGAVNLMVDMTESKQAEYFASQALRCERLAARASDDEASEILIRMAKEYRDKASSLVGRR